MLTFYLSDTIFDCFNEILSFVIYTFRYPAGLRVCVQFNSFNFTTENNGKRMYMTRSLRDTVVLLKVYQTLRETKAKI